jgi:hypothetical protein
MFRFLPYTASVSLASLLLWMPLAAASFAQTVPSFSTASKHATRRNARKPFRFMRLLTILWTPRGGLGAEARIPQPGRRGLDHQRTLEALLQEEGTTAFSRSSRREPSIPRRS